MTASSNNVQRENDVINSAENNSNGKNGNGNNVMEILSLADTEPYHQGEINLVTAEAVEIEIHRLTLKNGIIKAFKNIETNQKVKFKIYDHTGKLEGGMGVGVNRDMYASVWLESIDLLFVGTSERVPYIKHDLYFEEWEAVGNLLLHEITSCAYFPIQLSKAFVMFCLFGEAPDNSIPQSFLQYLSSTEKEFVKTALSCSR